MPRCPASAIESSTLPGDENGIGIVTARTFSGPTAAAARQQVTAESIPPESPMTAFVKPHLRM